MRELGDRAKTLSKDLALVLLGHSSGAHESAVATLAPDQYAPRCDDPLVAPDALVGLAGDVVGEVVAARQQGGGEVETAGHVRSPDLRSKGMNEAQVLDIVIKAQAPLFEAISEAMGVVISSVALHAGADQSVRADLRAFVQAYDAAPSGGPRDAAQRAMTLEMLRKLLQRLSEIPEPDD